MSNVSLADNGHSNYLLHCRGCHTATGAGVPSANMPSLQTLGPLLLSAEGRRYIIQIPGVAHTPLSDAEVAQVLNWVALNFNSDSISEDFERFTASEVAQARAEILVDPRKQRNQIDSGS